MTSRISFEISSDENNNPESIFWETSDSLQVEAAKSVIFGVWDAQGRGSMVMETWDKTMQTLEMKSFYLEVMKKMAETIKAATDDHVVGNIIENACFQINSLLVEEADRLAGK